MGEHPLPRFDQPRPVAADGAACGLVLGLDRAGLGQDAVEQLPGAGVPCGLDHPVDPIEGPEEVDGRRPAGAQGRAGGEEGLPDGLGVPVACGLPPHDDAEGRGDPDRGGPAHPERSDRLPDGRHVVEVDPDQLRRQPGLVDEPEETPGRIAHPADRLHVTVVAGACHNSSSSSSSSDSSGSTQA